MANFANESKSDSQKSQKVVKVIGVVAIAASVALCGYRAWTCIGDYQQHLANMSEFSSEQEKYDTQAMNAASTVPVEAPKVKDYVSAANKAGTELAKLQTGYQNMSLDKTGEYAEKQVGAYFTEDGQRDRVRWCENLKVPYTWEFMSAYEFKDGLIPCVFKCTVDDNVLVAYAYASFDPESGLFTNADRSYTSAVGPYQLAEGMNAFPTDDESGENTGNGDVSTDTSNNAAAGGNVNDNPPNTAAAGGNANDNPPSTTSSSGASNGEAGE